MYKTFRAILEIIWILDVLNLPFMEFLDTKYPVNGWAWFLILLCVPSTIRTYKEVKEHNESYSFNDWLSKYAKRR